MSVTYCHTCDKHIDTDYDVEHFEKHDAMTQTKPTGGEQLKDARLNDLYICEQGLWQSHPYMCNPLECEFVQEHILIELMKFNQSHDQTD